MDQDGALDQSSDCRLRNGLNPDCLAKIFGYLSDVKDLSTLANMDDYYKQIILRDVIPITRISLGSTHFLDSKIMEMFGKKLTNFDVTIDTTSFHGLLENIVAYCTEGQFKRISINICGCDYRLEHGYDAYLMKQASNYCKNVQSLSINSTETQFQGRGFISDTILKLFETSKMLRKVEIFNIALNQLADPLIRRKSMLNYNWMLNLTELKLVRVKVFTTELVKFFQRRPKLRHFINEDSIHANNMAEIGEALVEYCGENIVTFCDSWNHQMRELWMKPKRLLNRYQFISKLINVKKLKLNALFGCGSDLYYAIDGLAKYGKLEKLHINMRNASLQRHTHELKLPFTEVFRTLKTIEFSLLLVSPHGSLEFLTLNANQILTNVKACGLTMNQVYPEQIISLMPRLGMLIINEAHFDYKSVIKSIKNALERQNNEAVMIGVEGDRMIDVILDGHRVPRPIQRLMEL